jgi:hypothetical protein
MDTTAQIRPPRTPHGSEQPTEPGRGASSERRALGEMLGEVVPLVECIPVDGPSVALVLGPWLFLVLMLAGPCVCLLAVTVAMLVAATVLAALAAAVLAPPYLLVGHLRRHRARQASTSATAAQRVAIESPRVAA